MQAGRSSEFARRKDETLMQQMRQITEYERLQFSMSDVDHFIENEISKRLNELENDIAKRLNASRIGAASPDLEERYASARKDARCWRVMALLFFIAAIWYCSQYQRAESAYWDLLQRGHARAVAR